MSAEHSGPRTFHFAQEAPPGEEARVYLSGIQKRVTLESAVQEGQASDGEINQWGGVQFIPPPLPVEGLIRWYGRSALLRPNVIAMAQHVTGYGWTLKPTIALWEEDAAEQVETAMWLNRLAQHEAKGEKDAPPPEAPTADEVKTTLEEWRRNARLEQAMLTMKLKSLCYEMPLDELNRRQELNQNIVGWGAWEVIRDQTNKIVRLKHVEPWTLRLTPLGHATEVTESVPISPVHYKQVRVERKFRKIIQQDVTEYRFFREFGDPRPMSPRTGHIFATIEDLQAEDGENARSANELIIFADYFPGTPYGQPPWHGISPSVRGTRLAADNVVDDLANSSVPRGLLLAADTRLGKGATDNIQAFFNAHHGELRNRLLVIEAVTSSSGIDSTGNVHAKLEYIPLKTSQESDATFMEYQERSALDCGAQFGIPPIITGRTKEYNFATAQAAQESAEEGTFCPKRSRFDSTFNRTIMRDLGARFWEFASNGPVKSNPEKVADLLKVALTEGVVMPSEARPIIEKLLGVDLTTEAWEGQRIPLKALLAGHQPPKDTTAEEATGEDKDGEEDAASVEGTAQKLLDLYADAKRAGAEAELAKMGAGWRTEGEALLAETEETKE